MFNNYAELNDHDLITAMSSKCTHAQKESMLCLADSRYA